MPLHSPGHQAILLVILAALIKDISPLALNGDDAVALKGAPVTLHCHVTNITDTVTATWSSAEYADLSNVTGYSVHNGTYLNGSQNSTLTVQGAYNLEDTIYNCTADDDIGNSTTVEVKVDVFELIAVDDIVTDSYNATPICYIKDLDTPVKGITWTKSTGGAITRGLVKNYYINDGLNMSVSKDENVTCHVTVGEEVFSRDVMIDFIEIEFPNVLAEQGSNNQTLVFTIKGAATAASQFTWYPPVSMSKADYNATRSGLTPEGTQNTTATISTVANTTQEGVWRVVVRYTRSAQLGFYRDKSVEASLDVAVTAVAPLDAIVKFGNNATFECKGLVTKSGYNPYYSWKFGSADQLSDTSTLTVQANDTMDQTTAVCTVCYSFVNDATCFNNSDPANLFIERSAVLRVFDIAGEDVTTLRNTSVILTCFITSLPSPPSYVTWRTSKDPDLSTVAGYNVTIGDYNVTGYTTTLNMSQSESMIDDVYTCVVSPDGGSDQWTEMKLDVFLISVFDSHVIHGSNITLSCDVADIATPPADITWYTRYKSHRYIASNLTEDADYIIDDGEYNTTTLSQTSTLTFTANPNTTDKAYTCVVYPGANNDNQSAEIWVRSIELYQDTVYQIVEVGTEEVNFTCSTTYRETGIQWSVDGVEVITGVEQNNDTASLTSTLTIPSVNTTGTVEVKCWLDVPSKGVVEDTARLDVWEIEGPEYRAVLADSNTTFTCTTTMFSMVPIITWYMEDGHTMTTNYTVDSNSTSDSFTSILTLMNVNMADCGVYHCNVTYNEVTEVTVQSQGAQLYVTEWISELDTQTILHTLNTSLVLTCEMESGDLGSNVMWRYDGVEIVNGTDGFMIEHSDNSSSVLTKDGVEKGDGGRYSCHFDFGVFEAQSSTDLYIHYLAPLVLDTVNPSTIICTYEGTDEPRLNWTLSTTQIGYNVSTTDFENNTLTSTLSLDIVDVSSVIYPVYANCSLLFNETDDRLGESTLFHIRRISSYSPTQYVTTSTTTVTCVLDYGEGPPVSVNWYGVESLDHGSEYDTNYTNTGGQTTATLSLYNMTDNTFTCSFNYSGSESYTAEVEVIVRRAEINNPSPLCIREGDNASIICSFYGSEEPFNVTWSLNDNVIDWGASLFMADHILNITYDEVNKEGELTLWNVSDAELSGTYKCEFRLDVAQDNLPSAEMELLVVDLATEENEILKDTPGNLSCIFTSSYYTDSDLFTMYWSTGREVIEYNGTDGYDVVETEVDNRTTLSTLTVSGNNTGYSSGYTCHVNISGQVFEEHTHLMVFGIQAVDVKVLNGRDANLTCEVTGTMTDPDLFSFSWWRAGQESWWRAGQESTDNSTLSRYQSTLSVDNVTQTTDYMCEVERGGRSYSKKVRLEVFDLWVNISSSNLYADLHSNLTLTCSFNTTEYNATTVTWSKDDDLLDPVTYFANGTAILHQSDVLYPDMGVYSCIVSYEEHGDISSESIVQYVRGMEVEREQYYISPGESVSVTCIAHGDPGQISYKIFDAEINDNHSANATLHQTKMELDVKMQETGNVTCTMLYDVDEVTKEVKAYIDVVVIELSSPEVLTGTTTNITCDVLGSRSTLTVQWLVNGTAFGELPEGLYKVYDGEPVDQKMTTIIETQSPLYDTQYMCHAVLGDRVFNETTELLVFDINIESVEVEQGTPTNMTCSVTGVTNTPLISWSIEGQVVNSNDNIDGFKVFDSVLVNGTMSSIIQTSSPFNDTVYTCRVEVLGTVYQGEAELLTFGIHGYDSAVLLGQNETLSCTIDGFDDPIVRDDVRWYENGTGISHGITWSSDTNTTKLELTPNHLTADKEYTCSFYVDKAWHNKTLVVDVFELLAVNDTVTSSFTALPHCMIEGLTFNTSITWTDEQGSAMSSRKGYIYGDITANSTEGERDNDTAIVPSITQDRSFTCHVTVKIPKQKTFNRTVGVDYIEMVLPRVLVAQGAHANLALTVSQARTNFTEFKWYKFSTTRSDRVEQPGRYSSADNSTQHASFKIINADYEQHEGVWMCDLTYITTVKDKTFTRVIDKETTLDIGASIIAPEVTFAEAGTNATMTCEGRVTYTGLIPTYTWSLSTLDTVDSTTEKNVSTLTVPTNQTLDRTNATCNICYRLDNKSGCEGSDVSINRSALLYVQSVEMWPRNTIYGAKGQPLNITCTYTSYYRENLEVEWWVNKPADYNTSISDNVYQSVLTLPHPVEDGNQEYKCNFTFSSNKANRAKSAMFNATQQFSIMEAATVLTVISGYNTTFNLTFTTPSPSFTNILYTWYNNTVMQVSNKTTTAPLTFQTGQLFYTDRSNKYYCELHWTSEDQNFTLRSKDFTLDMIESCKVELGGNDKTTLNSTLPYIVNNTRILTTCSAGWLLAVGGQYVSTCDVKKGAVQPASCIKGCWVPTTGPDTDFTFSDEERIREDENDTIHIGSTVSLKCTVNHTLKTNQTYLYTCNETGIALDGTCVIGCHAKPNNYTSAQPVLVPQTERVNHYLCNKNCITEEGHSFTESAECRTGEDIALDACFEPSINRTSVDLRVKSMRITFAPPSLPGRNVVSPTFYSVLLRQADESVNNQISTVTEPKVVFYDLMNNTEYTIEITAYYTGTNKVQGTSMTVRTEQQKVPDPNDEKDEGVQYLSIPMTVFQVSTLQVITVYLRKGDVPYSGDYRFTFIDKTKRRKRDVSDEVTLYNNAEQAYQSGDTISAYISEHPSSVEAVFTWYPYHYTRDKELKQGAHYAFVMRACRLEECATGAALPITTDPGGAPGAVIGIAIAVVMTIIIVLLVGGLLYRRRRVKYVPRAPLTDDIGGGAVMGQDGQEVDNLPLQEFVPNYDPIHVGDYLSYYKYLMEDTAYMLSTEWEELRKRVPYDQFSYTAGKNPEVKPKNRFADIIPYDETRVKLSPTGAPNSDYINANYLCNLDGQTEFIAAQGPKEETIDDFWRMIWENNTLTVVMVTNFIEKGRVKCSKYWSDDSGVVYGDITVALQGIELFPDYVMRTFIVTRAKESRIVSHFHYISWPDHGAPHTTSLIDFCRRCFSERMDGPVVVHCSAGVGRTGTLIVLHLQMAMLAEEQMIDLFGITFKLRQCRKLIVQAEVQYHFLYEAVREMILCGDTTIPVPQFTQVLGKMITSTKGNPMTPMDQEYRALIDYTESQAHKMSTSHGTTLFNAPKNRYANVLPFNATRVRLQVCTGVEGSDYINASYIDSYHDKGAYIATQGPKQSTITDFWRMVFEKDVSTIVMMTNLVEREREKCSQYWPISADSALCVDGIVVHLLGETNPDPNIVIRHLQISLPHREQLTERTIKQFHYTGWPEKVAPASGSSLIKMIDMVQKWHMQKGQSPIVVHCSAGIGRTAAFIAISNCIEQTKLDYIIDLFQISLRMRQQRPTMIQSVDQYRFCYRVIHEYIQLFDDYSNFK